jgi:hypothetical protein
VAQIAWIWRQYGFVATDCPNRLDRILVACHLSPSVSEATRCIKQGSVRFRRNHDEPWQSPREPRMALPTGWPYSLRVGKDSLRLLTREGRDGWDCFLTWAEVMLPEAHQGIRSWTNLVDRGRIGWWSYWLDKLQKFWETHCANTTGMARCPASHGQKA